MFENLKDQELPHLWPGFNSHKNHLIPPLVTYNNKNNKIVILMLDNVVVYFNFS